MYIYIYIYIYKEITWNSGIPGGIAVKNTPASVGDTGCEGSIPGLGRCPGVGNGNLLQYSCQENSMEREIRQATVHGFANSQT